MAPPRNRRPGFSRRAQYGLFIGYVGAAGGALVAAVLLRTPKAPAAAADGAADAEAREPIAA